MVTTTSAPCLVFTELPPAKCENYSANLIVMVVCITLPAITRVPQETTLHSGNMCSPGFTQILNNPKGLTNDVSTDFKEGISRNLKNLTHLQKS